eukprot:2123252-Prymnesium_polylepis.3
MVDILRTAEPSCGPRHPLDAEARDELVGAGVALLDGGTVGWLQLEGLRHRRTLLQRAAQTQSIGAAVRPTSRAVRVLIKRGDEGIDRWRWHARQQLHTGRAVHG